MLNFGEAQYGEVPLIGQRVEKLLHALFCVPFKDLKPRFRSVFALVPRGFDSVLGCRPVGHRLFQQAHSFLKQYFNAGYSPSCLARIIHEAIVRILLMGTKQGERPIDQRASDSSLFRPFP
jgi:hypothetical protein